MTNANYEESIKLLHERFVENYSFINAHYASLMDLAALLCNTTFLRTLYDQIKETPSLQALGKNVNTKMHVFLIMTKLLKDVITHLSDQKQDDQEWIVTNLMEKFHIFISNRRNTEPQCGIKEDSKLSANKWRTSQFRDTKTTTEALLSGNNPPKVLRARKRQICINGNGKHWSNECKQHPTVTARKEKQCFIVPAKTSPSQTSLYQQVSY